MTLMREILISIATVADGRDVFPGQSVTVADKTARELIAYGFATDPAAGPVDRGAPLYVQSHGNGTHDVSAKPFPKRGRK